jgi:hypothetical protein
MHSQEGRQALTRQDTRHSSENACVCLSAAPELLDLPAVRRLVQVQVDMQIADLLAMLRLPKPYVGLRESMNLTAATQIFSLISGMSVLLYRPDYEYLSSATHPGRRFKGLVREHMPLTHPEDLRSGHAAEVMWKFARNPLAHSFGVGKDRASFPGHPSSERDPDVFITKGGTGLHVRQARQLLAGDASRPPWLVTPTIAYRFGDRRAVGINIEALAWATMVMARSVLRSPHRVAAETLARRLLSDPQTSRSIS